MFGNRYCSTRQRLADLMHGLAALAADSGVDLTEHLPVRAENRLGRPWLLAVAGDVNVGKSSLINALCCHPLASVTSLPEHPQLRHYRWGACAEDVTSDPPRIIECRRPLEHLHHFEYLEVPVTGAQLYDPGLGDDVDLNFFVLTCENPWGAATWNAIERLPTAGLERTVLVLQHADTRNEGEIRLLLGHVRDLAQKRLGRVPPVFPLGLKAVADAGYQRDGRAAIWHASGLMAIEHQLDRQVCESPESLQRLESWRRQAADALYALDARIEDQSRNIGNHGQFLHDLEREIDGLREQFVARLPEHLARVAEVFEAEALGVGRQLRRRLGAAASLLRLFTGDRSGQAIEAALIEHLQSAVEAVAMHDAIEVTKACERHWRELGPRVGQSLGLSLDSPVTETLARAQEHFVSSLREAASQGVGNLKVRNRLDKQLRRRNRALKSFMVATLALTTLGASCGALGLPVWLPITFCSLAGLFLAGGVGVAWSARRAISADFEQTLLSTCDRFANALHTDYEEALRVVFQQYATALTPIRKHLAAENQAIKPRVQRWQELFLVLKAIEQDL